MKYDEFSQGYKYVKQNASETEIQKAFFVGDDDRNGLLSKEEFG